MSPFLRRTDEPTRRHFIARTASSLLGVGLLPNFFSRDALAADPAKAGRAKNVIYLYMDGGMSHVDTWDPKSGTVMGPTKTIKSSADGVLLGEYLPRTAKQMHHGTVVRSLTSTQGAHEQGNYFMHTSYQLRGTINHPSLGAWLQHFRGVGNPTLPGSVYVGNASRHPGAGFFSPELAPLFVNNPENGLKDIELQRGLTKDAHSARMKLAGELDADFVRTFGKQRNVAAHSGAYDGAYRMMASADIVAFDLTQEKAELRDAYGRDPFGQGCLLARRLVERGVRFVEVSLHGWDTHSNNFTATPDLCEKLDRGLATLVNDLHGRGMLRDTLVVVTTEFGRSPKINGSLGRDHYPKAFSAALFGGGVKGGFVFGATNPTAEIVKDDEISIPDFNATIGHALGLPVDEVVVAPNGRPFKLADKGKPVTGVFA
ncbi:MAG: DUF1501 domain-containing protein [Verrucomicrobia bacterium]|nr:DUF1501 domain-containing protein [Verrucomicrobiota bacterium]NBU11292.1 DUF1501 domain-containing protein [Pseudomonadota bacterium]NDA65384.1 DUF1501 domain-containing protein [Verrucomicrobiota bacterium]NDB74261.1 DUF1501 domain-containing protein [Verrucomicrobiota bacterium]NDD37196.1 DUF1501 domain-containing protein [Verrucomicrobiota bacterium]